MHPFIPDELLAINEEVDVEFHPVPGTNTGVVVADGVYKSPAEVRDFVKSIPVPIWKHLPNGGNFRRYYDCRHQMIFRFLQVQGLVADLGEQFLGIRAESMTDVFTTNVFRLIEDQPPNTVAFPHDDGLTLAALVSLNTPDEESGGTAFYRHKQTGLTQTPTTPEGHQQCVAAIFKDEREDGSEYFVDHRENWEQIAMIPMKFNRMLIWPGVLFHGAWHEHNAFKDYWRINHVMFLENVTFDWKG